MRPVLLALVALSLGAPLLAQQPMKAPGSRSAAAVSGGSYTADPGHTLVRWEVDHLGFSPYFGIFGDVSGTLTLDPKNLAAAKVSVTIPVSKVTTASAGLTAHLLKPAAEDGKPDFFGAAPVAARFYGAGKMPAAMGGKENVGFTATTTIKRSDFGIGFGIPMVSDAVKLDIAAAFEK